MSLLLWAFTIGSAVELVALHVVRPWERARLVADILGIWGLLWMLGFTASHYVYPHLLGPDGLREVVQRVNRELSARSGGSR